MYFSRRILLLFSVLLMLKADAQKGLEHEINPELFGDNAAHWYGIADKKNMIHALPGKPVYNPYDVRQIADNILLFQKNNGGWPKNYDMFAILTGEQEKEVSRHRNDTNTTFDNGTGYSQIKALAIAYNIVKEEKYKEAAIKGLQFVLDAQYSNGGWPQYFPLQNNYSRYITFNDGAMTGIMKMLKEINDGNTLYDFVGKSLRERLKEAYIKGIDCILNSQIIDHGKPTAWCQQHDEVTLKPVWARAFEPPAICNGESSGIVLFLMSIDHPDKRIIAAIQSAVRWFKSSEILNTRVKKVRKDSLVTNFRISTTDNVVVTDSTAPPIWTRYYEPGTHRSIFCNRDSKIVYSLAEVHRERRDGYAWYVYSPQAVLNRYPEWQKKWAHNDNVLITKMNTNE